MAEGGVLLAQDQFSCPICLDLLKDPVAIPCGHSFCMDCIPGVWDEEDSKGVSCPQCGQTFTPRSVLGRNTKVEDRICSQHDRVLEVFCRTDQTCICILCAMGEHKNHDTVSIAAERNEEQKELGKSPTKFQVIIKEKENHLQELRQAVKTLQCSADAAVENSERVCKEMIHYIEKSCSEVTKVIRDQERADMSQAEKHIELQEGEIIELKRVAELDQLSNSENHVFFLNSFQSLCARASGSKSSSYSVCTDVLFEVVTDSFVMVKEKLCKGLQHVTDAGENVSIFTAPQPVTRQDFLKYSRRLTFDPNTANFLLLLSEGNKVVENSGEEKRSQYPQHLDRFDATAQVMCRQKISSRCYWEVELSGHVYIAVSYKGLRRKGKANCVFLGRNAISWSLYFHQSGFAFIHNDETTHLPHAQSSSRIGVYVDHRAGTLCFYSVTDKLTLLHKVQTTFTEPLYPAFWVAYGSKIVLGQ